MWKLAAVTLLAICSMAAAQPAAKTCPPGHVWKDPEGCVCNVGGTITCGLGLCEVTIPACNAAGVANQCIPNDPPTPGVDVCNGKDDDCDGLIDEDDAEKTVSCGTGVCQNTVKVCLNGEWTGGAWCYPRLEQKTKEVCDGLDNDCNGVVDDLGFITCGKGLCKRTVPICTNGTLNECVPGAPRDEVCDNLDNDCDGLIDEDLGHTKCPGVPGERDFIYNCYEGKKTVCPDQCRIPSGPTHNCEGRCGRPPVTGVWNFTSGTWTTSHPFSRDGGWHIYDGWFKDSGKYGRDQNPIPDTLPNCNCDSECWIRGDCCADIGPACDPDDNYFDRVELANGDYDDFGFGFWWAQSDVPGTAPDEVHCIYCPQMLERYDFYLRLTVNNTADKAFVRTVFDAALRQLQCSPEMLCAREAPFCAQLDPCVEDESQCIPWLEAIALNPRNACVQNKASSFNGRTCPNFNNGNRH